jgi:hypothetical protein
VSAKAVPRYLHRRTLPAGKNERCTGNPFRFRSGQCNDAFLYKEVGKEKITDAWTDGLADNLTVAEMKALKSRLDKFNTLFRTMHEGEVIQISYLPGTGTEVRINGEWRGNVEGDDFFHSLLTIWLGAHPVSNSLKQDMLGIN